MNDTSAPVATRAPAANKLLTTEEVAEMLGGDFSVRTLEDWRRLGGGPDYVKIGGSKRGGGTVRYRLAAVDRWLDSCERKTAGRVA